MNWKLIFSLSLFGLAMAMLTLELISSSTEPYFWIGIFLICAYLIARKAPRKYFLHGFLVSIFNCVWITAIHAAMSDNYITYHAKEAEEYAKINEMFGLSIPQAMLLVGPIVGISTGVVLGLLSLLASKIFKKAV